MSEFGACIQKNWSPYFGHFLGWNDVKTWNHFIKKRDSEREFRLSSEGSLVYFSPYYFSFLEKEKYISVTVRLWNLL